MLPFSPSETLYIVYSNCWNWQ